MIIFEILFHHDHQEVGERKNTQILKNYIHQHTIPKNLSTDQYSGFKIAKVAEFCKSKGINQIFCPVGDHRGCGSVERCIQTIKRKLGTIQLDPIFEDIQTSQFWKIFEYHVTASLRSHLSNFISDGNRIRNGLISGIN